MSALAWLRRYAAHPDPATAAANLVALVVAGNGPFYPLYVLALVGRAGDAAWLTMAASPLFFAVPAVARWNERAGRAALPLIGTVNTVWCAALFGSATGVGLFLLPCAALVTLLYRKNERWRRLALLGLIIAAQIALAEAPLPGLMHLGLHAAAALVRLNTISVTTLTAFIAITIADVLLCAFRPGEAPRTGTGGAART